MQAVTTNRKRSDRCQADKRCRRPVVVHYKCNGIDKLLCEYHRDLLYDRIERELEAARLLQAIIKR